MIESILHFLGLCGDHHAHANAMDLMGMSPVTLLYWKGKFSVMFVGIKGLFLKEKHV